VSEHHRCQREQLALVYGHSARCVLPTIVFAIAHSYTRERRPYTITFVHMAAFVEQSLGGARSCAIS